MTCVQMTRQLGWIPLPRRWGKAVGVWRVDKQPCHQLYDLHKSDHFSESVPGIFDSVPNLVWIPIWNSDPTSQRLDLSYTKH
jgi:hypothetical protein